MRVVAERHQDVYCRLEKGSCCQTTDMGVNRAEGERAARASVWIAVVDDLIDQLLDLVREEGSASNARQATYSLTAARAQDDVVVDQGVLGLISKHAYAYLVDVP